jgi:hypothetical protein
MALHTASGVVACIGAGVGMDTGRHTLPLQEASDDSSKLCSMDAQPSRADRKGKATRECMHAQTLHTYA